MAQSLERPSSGRLDGKFSLPAGNAFAELFPPGRRTRVLRTEWNVDCERRRGYFRRRSWDLEASPGAPTGGS